MHMSHVRRSVCAVAVLVAIGSVWPEAQPLQKITINYPTRSGASWPLYIAKEGGYYQKYGLDPDLQFGVHPTGIAMLTSGQAVCLSTLQRSPRGDKSRFRVTCSVSAADGVSEIGA